MKCDNRCSNPAEYRIHRVGQEPKNVCSAHKYVETHSTDESMFTIQPLTLEGHIAEYKWHSEVCNLDDKLREMLESIDEVTSD